VGFPGETEDEFRQTLALLEEVRFDWGFIFKYSTRAGTAAAALDPHPDYLMFELPNGDSVPCSAETVTFELIGDAADNLDPEVVKNAAAAVLHYFQQELQRDSVSVGEFSEALEEVLRGFGFKVQTAGSDPPSETTVAEADLDTIARESAESGELFFFSRLRDELRNKLPDTQGPGLLQHPADLPDVPRQRQDHPRALHHLPWRRQDQEAEDAGGEDSRRHQRRHAHPLSRQWRTRHQRRPLGRPVHRDPRQAA
jgi:hypothetical protein